MKEKALVIFTGGQDTTTCLYWAKKNFKEVVAIGFDYGPVQPGNIRHAKNIAAEAGIEYIILPVIGLLQEDALSKFSNGTNALLLAIAAMYGHKRSITDIVVGIRQSDRNYAHDCNENFLKWMEITLSLGIYGNNFNQKFDQAGMLVKEPVIKIHAPLMHLTKAETFKLAKELDCVEQTASLKTKDYYKAKEKGWI